jgi:hypothetical protein
MPINSVPEGHSIVIAGHWNVMIFTPQWVTERFERAPGIEMMFPINSPTPNIRFGVENLFLVVTPERLTVLSREVTTEAFTQMQVLANRILTDLVHTPVSAVGMNLVFTTETPEGSVLDLFRLGDNHQLVEKGLAIRESTIRRSMADDDRTLNLEIRYVNEPSRLTFDFNYNADVPSIAAAVEKISIGMTHFQTRAHDILRTLYGQEVE